MVFKRFGYFLSFLFINFFSSSQGSEEISFTPSNTRPNFVQEYVDKTFEKISSYKEKRAAWNYNGRELYKPFNFNELKLFANFILGNPSQKEFYALDIGCGDGSWGKNCFEFIKSQIEQGLLPSDARVHIVNLAGEPYPDEILKEGRHILYQYGAFKIENIEEEFKKRNIFQGIKFDFIITQMCFRHLVDPVGTFEQVYNLLTLNGFLFIDKFFIFYDKDNYSRYVENQDALNHMLFLFLSTGSPFLVESHNRQGGLGKQNFLIKKAFAKAWEMPLSYVSAEEKDLQPGLNSMANYCIRFKAPVSEREIVMIPYNLRDFVLYGDEELYKKLDEIDAWWVSSRGEKIRPDHASILWKNT